MFANINLLAASVLLYFPQDILYRGSWSATVLSSHSHIQITNYSMSISHCQKCTVGADGIYIPPLPPSISPSLSPPSCLPLSLPSSCPSWLSFSLLSLQSDQELILWILTLIQWDSYNPLSDYAATHMYATFRHTHSHTHACTYNTGKHHLDVYCVDLNTWCTSLHGWCPCKSSAKWKREVGLVSVYICVCVFQGEIFNFSTYCKLVYSKSYSVWQWFLVVQCKLVIAAVCDNVWECVYAHFVSYAAQTPSLMKFNGIYREQWSGTNWCNPTSHHQHEPADIITHTNTITSVEEKK